MKAFCSHCGCHFPQDFNDAITCGWWVDRNLERLSLDYKRVLWDWQFQIPLDEIWLKEGISVAIDMYGLKTEMLQTEKPWPDLIPNYLDMTEAEQQAAQKSFFLKRDEELRNRPLFKPGWEDKALLWLGERIKKRRQKNGTKN